MGKLEVFVAGLSLGLLLGIGIGKTAQDIYMEKIFARRGLGYYDSKTGDFKLYDYSKKENYEQQ